MSEIDEANNIFGALPIDAQERFNRLWSGILSDITARRGPMNDPDLLPFVEMMVKLMYVSGYSSALNAEKARNAEMRRAIEEKFGEYLDQEILQASAAEN